MPTAGVDFFRVDRSGATYTLLGLAVVLIMVGMTCIGAHLVHRLPQETAHYVSLAGGLMTITGLVLGFGAMAMLLFENVYLLIREDGLLCHENGKETVIAWGDLDDVTLGDAGIVLFARKGKEPFAWFAGKKSAERIHSHVAAARRKALHGLLKSN